MRDHNIEMGSSINNAYIKNRSLPVCPYCLTHNDRQTKERRKKVYKQKCKDCTKEFKVVINSRPDYSTEELK